MPSAMPCRIVIARGWALKWRPPKSSLTASRLRPPAPAPSLLRQFRGGRLGFPPDSEAGRGEVESEGWDAGRVTGGEYGLARSGIK